MDLSKHTTPRALLACLEKREEGLKAELNNIRADIAALRLRQRQQVYLTIKNAPVEIVAHMGHIGHYLDQLPFDDLPRRITFGRSQFKFVSREVAYATEDKRDCGCRACGGS